MEDKVNAIKLLTNQHREVDALFKKMESSEKQSDSAKKKLFQDIQQRLDLHTQLEEKIFYPEGKEVDEMLTLESLEEHDLVKSLLKKISKTDPGKPEFMAQVTVLKKLVEHHVDEEESEFFPQCEKEFGDEKLEELGEQMLEEQERITSKMHRKSAA
jgi:hemerythrin-like domain-containing protein